MENLAAPWNPSLVLLFVLVVLVWVFFGGGGGAGFFLFVCFGGDLFVLILFLCGWNTDMSVNPSLLFAFPPIFNFFVMGV